VFRFVWWDLLALWFLVSLMFATDLEAVMSVFIFPFSIYPLLSDFVNLCSLIVKFIFLCFPLFCFCFPCLSLLYPALCSFCCSWTGCQSRRRDSKGCQSTLIIITVNCYKPFVSTSHLVFLLFSSSIFLFL